MKQNEQTVDRHEAHFRLWDMLYFVVWFEMLSGLTEITLLRMKGLIGGGAVHLRCHTMWMSPAINVAVLGVVGVTAWPLILRLS